MERLALGLLIALCIYGFFAVVLPYLTILLSVFPSNSFEDERLTGVHSLGRFSCGQFSTVRYELRRDGIGELIIENSLCKNVTAETERQGGVYITKQVTIGNRIYKETLRDHPEVLAEAEKILQIGRNSFAKAKKKLE